MAWLWTPTLAFGTLEIIIVGIFLSISAVRWIIKQLQEQREMQARRQARLDAERQGSFSSSSRSGEDQESNSAQRRTMPMQTGLTSSSGDSLEEIAARRRREIATMARGGTNVSGGSGAGAGTGQRPDNLTMQQMRQRMAAKLEYERRAQLLREGRQSASPSPATSSPSPTVRKREPLDMDLTSIERAERARRLRNKQEQAQIKAEAKRQVEIQSQRQAAARNQQVARQAQNANLRQTHSARSPVAAPPQALPSRRIQMQLEGEEGPRRSSVTGARELSQRTDAAVSAPTAAATINLQNGPMLITGRSLRDAIVLREILDPPVSLRSDPMLTV